MTNRTVQDHGTSASDTELDAWVKPGLIEGDHGSPYVLDDARIEANLRRMNFVGADRRHGLGGVDVYPPRTAAKQPIDKHGPRVPLRRVDRKMSVA